MSMIDESTALEKDFQFLFSVIMPIYNTEQYLEEAIESVIGQSIGFRENIQLILVNNATEDNSGEICERYAEEYPDNVMYIKLEQNCRPSGARNAAMPYIEGKYVNFFDSDDIWPENAFEKVWDFFDKHETEIDVVACRMKFFEGQNGYHALDYKFRRDGVVSIHRDYDYIQLHVTSAFIKRETLQGKRFNLELHSSEDSRFINEIILEKQRYGLMRSVVYQYRKRADGTSAVQTFSNYIKYYNIDLELCPLYLAELSRQKFGKVIPYVQWHMMYTVQWRLKEPLSETLTEDQVAQYIRLLLKILSMVDDYIIMAQKNIFKEFKLYALKLKYGEFFWEKLRHSRDTLYFNDLSVMNFSKDSQVLVLFILEQKGDTLHLEGRVNVPLKEESYQIFAKDENGDEYYPRYVALNEKETVRSLEEIILVRRGVVFDIPLCDGRSISFYIRHQDVESEISPKYGFWGKLTYEMDRSYYLGEQFLLRRKKRKIAAETITRNIYINAERSYLKELRRKKKNKAFVLRLFVYFYRRLFHKKIWLFIDRVATAGDNAEYLLDYVTKQSRTDIKTYYVLGRDSKDYERMRAKANVVIYGSRKYKVLYVLSDMIISAVFDRYIFEFFGWQTEYLKNLFNYKYVYLQHGVIKDDLSATNWKFKDNANIFITSAYSEYKSMLELPYGYTEKEIKLTGLARFDGIANMFDVQPRKHIVIAPTWRRYLANQGGINRERGAWDYDPYFKESDYYKFYNNLLNDERLLSCMRKNGYTGSFRLHPAAVAQAVDFHTNDCFTLDNRDEEYAKAIVDTALMITDYSSLAIDYAYAKRPVIYSQFDKEEFYAGHIAREGYFEYERDGFGPVCYDYESTVQAIISAIESGCAMEEKYRRRVDNFFAFRDGKNCERIYQEILKLEKVT